MKNFKILAFTGLAFLAILFASCTPKEGVCECTGVFEDTSIPDSTWQEIRPNGNKDCTWLEGRHYFGSSYWDITCTKLN